MIFDAGAAVVAVRTTARISAVILAANLIASARRLPATAPAVAAARQARTLDLATFAAFLVSHTIHFATVAWLAFATNGASMRDSGGWIPAMGVAAIFYLIGWDVFRGKRRPGSRWHATWPRRREMMALSAIWLIFFQAYALRFGRPLFAVFAVGLLYALVRFLAAARRPSSFVGGLPEAPVNNGP